MNRRWNPLRTIVSLLMATVLVGSLVSCGDRALTTPSGTSKPSSSLSSGQISEVSPPEVIQQLRPALESYQPQVTILSPQADEVLQDTTVAVRLQVRDLPIFKDPQLGLGPHLHVILDNQPYKAVYDLEQPLVFEDLAPGTHTLRVFASRPWHESFKNEGAYAQTTFHLFTKTTDNNPDPGQPLLTYSRPTGSYGAEPIMLDFYLTNAPLHLVAQSNPDDEIADWRVRVTVNGQSFVMDRWQPLYLKGFNSGKNWVQLEFLDEQGNPVTNVFNNTVRLITYEPKGKDTLAKLVRGELSATAARGIVNPNYSGKTPVPTATPEPSFTPTPTPTPEPLAPPAVEETPAPQLSKEEPTSSEVEPAKPAEAPPATKQLEKPQGGFFNRFRRSEAPVSPPPALPVPEAIEEPSSLAIPPEKIPQPGTLPEITPSPEASPEVETVPSTPPASPAPKQVEKPKGGFFNRFRRPDAGVDTPTRNLPPALPEIVPSPAPEEPLQVVPAQPDLLQPPSSPQPTDSVQQKTEETTQSAQSSPTFAQAKPKADIKDVLIPKPAAAPPLRIIQAPSEPDIPSRFFQKSKPATPELEVPTAENPEDAQLGEAATP
ncbi:hypothetical protein [Coleofasciculus sp. FACHB-SPT9]|uniref:hypothetical protein n=1 Tax=Cyanophyceae TaxID=3028117 RepID=UPI0016871EB6|nr:hypothetical protein [Coleofasciculus sp. FACHB-SPT9]MBD1891069.1 hypothetical protein [Coleofasciculus sp. FACHB-SPT9]